jgi:3-dehydroquinate dehydratase-1
MKVRLIASLPFRSLNDLNGIEEVQVDLIELRMDYSDNLDSGVLEKLIRFRDKILITVRDPVEGGVRGFTDDEKSSFLKLANDLGFLYDVEASFLRRAPVPYEGKVVSSHYLSSLPSLTQVKRELDPYYHRAAYIKVAVLSRPGYKGLLASLLDVYERIAVMPLGAQGLDRIAFTILGSKLLYTHLGTPTAQGQLSLAEAKRVLDMLNSVYSSGTLT